MAVKFAENFVSYHLDIEDRGIAAADLEAVNASLRTATAVTTVNNLKTRRKLLEWQVLLEAADDDFRGRRYEKALAGYRKVSKYILELLEPKVSKVRTPRVWSDGPAITKALTAASASFLQNLLPAEDEQPPVLTEGVQIDLNRLGAEPGAPLTVTQTVPDAVMPLVERASVAANQGRFDEASNLYQRALAATPADNRQLQAELLLNLGASEIQRNQSAAALGFLRRAQEAFQGVGDQVGVAEALHNTGFAHVRAGNTAGAETAFNEARKVAGQATLQGLVPRSAAAPTNGGVTAVPVISTPLIPRLTFATPITSIRALSVTSLAAVPREIEIDKAANLLGTANFELKVRAIGKQSGSSSSKLSSPAQERAEDFGRTLSTVMGGRAVSLKWTKQQPLGAAAFTELYNLRATTKGFRDVGFRPVEPQETATYLPHLYQFVLPVKMGDCLHELNQFEQAHVEYLRASRFDKINTALEAPDLWRRIVENVADWGDSLYRDEQTEQALPIYELVMTKEGLATNSILYTTASLQATGNAVKAWLQALRDEAALPVLNHSIAQVLYRVRRRWTYIVAGLDFFGALATVVPPFSFRYLQEVARYFAERSIQAEQRYIDFYTRFESEQMTRRELDNAYEQSLQGVEIARQNEAAAKATVDASVAAVNLANVRKQGAQDMLNSFNNVAWEMEVLAGFIARGNAWTGGDLPNLKYTIDGYTYDGKKHEVLQDITQRQTQISNDLQRQRMQASVNELTAGQDVANKQKQIADARHAGAKAETKLAEMRRDQAKEMRDAFNNEKFNPEQWLAMAALMKGLANTALDRAIEVARLMQKTYNFENFDTRQVIRSSYKIASTNELLGGEVLLSDIDSFTFYHVTRVAQKPVPAKWAISLSEEFPGQFLQFTRNGRMDFDIDIERLALAYPGTFRHQIKGVELEIDGFIPPTGLSGRLTNSGLGNYRDSAGQAHRRVQPAETLVLSRYNRRQDAIILSPPQEMRSLFEGNTVASGWTLEVPKSTNDVDLRLVFDARLVVYFECLFDRTLFQQDSVPPAGLQVERTRALSLRQHFPDAYFQLRESGVARLQLTAEAFPLNQRQPVLRSLALAISPETNATLAGARFAVTYPGQAAAVNVTVAAQNVVQKGNFPIAANTSALGEYVLTLNAADRARKDQIFDLTVVMDYRYTPGA